MHPTDRRFFAFVAAHVALLLTACAPATRRQVVNPPAMQGLRTYPVTVDVGSGNVVIQLPG